MQVPGLSTRPAVPGARSPSAAGPPIGLVYTM